MRSEIRGKVYNTETSRMISSFEKGDPDTNGYRYEALYKKRNGEFFLYRKEYTSEMSEDIKPLTLDRVRTWAVRNMESSEYKKFMAKESTLKVVSVRLIPDKPFYKPFAANNVASAVQAVREEFKLYDREVFAVLSVTNHLDPISLHVCSVGTLTSTPATPTEVFKAALLSNAAGVILFHNHPSGSIDPSEEDIMLTKRMVEAGKIMGITVLDHIIVAARTGNYYNIRTDEDNLKALGIVFDSERPCLADVEDTYKKNDRVYLNVYNDFARVGMESRSGDGQTYNVVTLPKGTIVNDLDLSGGKIYPLDMYIYPNKFNDNLTTVQYRPEQEIQVNLKNGDKIKVNAKALCEGVDAANKNYLSQHRELTHSKEKDRDLEI